MVGRALAQILRRLNRRVAVLVVVVVAMAATGIWWKLRGSPGQERALLKRIHQLAVFQEDPPDATVTNNSFTTTHAPLLEPNNIYTGDVNKDYLTPRPAIDALAEFLTLATNSGFVITDLKCGTKELRFVVGADRPLDRRNGIRLSANIIVGSDPTKPIMPYRRVVAGSNTYVGITAQPVAPRIPNKMLRLRCDDNELTANKARELTGHQGPIITASTDGRQATSLRVKRQLAVPAD